MFVRGHRLDRDISPSVDDPRDTVERQAWQDWQEDRDDLVQHIIDRIHADRTRAWGLPEIVNFVLDVTHEETL